MRAGDSGHPARRRKTELAACAPPHQRRGARPPNCPWRTPTPALPSHTRFAAIKSIHQCSSRLFGLSRRRSRQPLNSAPKAKRAMTTGTTLSMARERNRKTGIQNGSRRPYYPRSLGAVRLRRKARGRALRFGLAKNVGIDARSLQPSRNTPPRWRGPARSASPYSRSACPLAATRSESGAHPGGGRWGAGPSSDYHRSGCTAGLWQYAPWSPPPATRRA